MSALPKAPEPAPEADDQNTIRVIVVDDSVVVRGLLSRWLSERSEIEVIGTFRDGKVAVDALDRLDPHIVVLDVEMPVMDGLTALPLILRKRPGTQVLMASTLTRRNAEISLKALGLGARDYIPKPEGNQKVSTSEDFRDELIRKVLALGAKPAGLKTIDPDDPTGREAPSPSVTPGAAASLGDAARPARSMADAPPLRSLNSIRPRILAIGSSTGGPQALMTLLAELAPSLKTHPVVLTQHMPPSFTAILAEHITRASGMTCKEGKAGEPLSPGTIYVAPGGSHMVVATVGGTPVIEISDDPPVNFCKPAVDPLFESVAEVFGPASLGLVLTGMGHDGGAGALKIADAGGNVIAQDEATSVVWGMPGAAVRAGSVCAVLPLNKIASKVKSLIAGVVQ